MGEGGSPRGGNEMRGELGGGGGSDDRSDEQMWRHIWSSREEQRCPVTHLWISTLPPTRSEWENGMTDCARLPGKP